MKTSFRSVRFLLPFLWKASPQAPLRIFLSLICLVMSKLMLLSVPFFYRALVNQFETGHATPTGLIPILLGYGGARFLSTVFSESRDALFIPVEQRAIRQLTKDVFNHLHTLSLRFHLDRSTGAITQTLERGGRAIETFFRFFVFNLCPTLLELVLVITIIGFFYHLIFSLILLATLLGYIYVTYKISQWRLPMMQSLIGASNAGGARAVDSLINYATVKYFSNEKVEGNRYDEFLKIYQKRAELNKYSLCGLNLAQAFVLALGTIIISSLASFEILSGKMTVGDFVLISTFLLQVYIPLHILGFSIRETKQALTDMDGLFNLLHTPQDIKDAPGASLLKVSEGAIEFRNVTFGYHAERPILNNISFKLSPRQTIAIVGPSGAGKSTLVSLLFRFFDPDTGSILIDGQDIRTVTQSSLREAIAIVPQDTPLFNDSIFYNIAYGNLEASSEEIYEAARHAEVESFIKQLPEKYDTIVGERGLKISGGEKQRLALARAFLKKPPIFVFDEATSSLDTQTEQSIQDNLKTLSRGHTTLIVAHRLSTITDADSILVMEKGSIKEVGTHKTLLEQGGFYANLWTKQLKEDPS
jgi:ABC-type transport system involved in Fe-S cluster assembly fused permease/ATPase subunit